jgi:hypothetical protein
MYLVVEGTNVQPSTLGLCVDFVIVRYLLRLDLDLMFRFRALEFNLSPSRSDVVIVFTSTLSVVSVLSCTRRCYVVVFSPLF